MDMTSDYKQTFQVHPVQEKFIREKPVWQPPKDKFIAETTSKSDFMTNGTKHVRAECIRPKGELELSREPFQASSTIQSEFPAHKVTPRQKKPPAEYQPPQGHMETRSSYGSEFPIHPFSKLPPIKPSENKPDSKPFEGVSENNERFRNYQRQEFNGARPANCKPKHEYIPPDVQFETNTTSKSEYSEKKGARPNNYKPKHEYVPPDVQFETTTTSKSQYSEIKGDHRSHAVKYPGELHMSSEPLHTETTNKGDFSARREVVKIDKRTAIKPNAELTLSKEPFHANTTNKGDFGERREVVKIDKRTAIKPHAELTLSTDRFDSSTTNKGDFTPRREIERIEKRQPIKHSDEIQTPRDEPFSKSTTANSTYNGTKPTGGRTQAIRHSGELGLSTDAFDGRTINHDTFTEKKRELQTDKNGVVQHYGRRTIPIT